MVWSQHGFFFDFWHDPSGWCAVAKSYGGAVLAEVNGAGSRGEAYARLLAAVKGSA